jgi:hypothetical protein
VVKINLTDEQIAAARKAGQSSLKDDFHAEAAWYEAAKDLVWIKTTAGTYHGVPSFKLQGLAGASPEQLADIEVSPQGGGLHWPQLDADLTVQGIIFGVYGTQAWMAELGRKGGQGKSVKKAAAARENGKKGGRPRKLHAYESNPVANLIVAEEKAHYSTSSDVARDK